MKSILRTSLLVLTTCVSGLTSCSELSEKRTAALENRIDRQDARIQGRNTRRAMRAEAEERRYRQWFDRIMGRPNPDF